MFGGISKGSEVFGVVRVGEGGIVSLGRASELRLGLVEGGLESPSMKSTGMSTVNSVPCPTVLL